VFDIGWWRIISFYDTWSYGPIVEMGDTEHGDLKSLLSYLIKNCVRILTVHSAPSPPRAFILTMQQYDTNLPQISHPPVPWQCQWAIGS